MVIRDYGKKNRKCEKWTGGFFVLIITITAHNCLGAWERPTSFSMVTESSIAYSYRYIVSEGERDAGRLKLTGLSSNPYRG